MKKGIWPEIVFFDEQHESKRDIRPEIKFLLMNSMESIGSVWNRNVFYYGIFAYLLAAILVPWKS